MTPCCVSLPLTPWAIQLLESAAKISRSNGDNYVRVWHIAEAVKTPPAHLTEVKPPAPKRRILIPTKPCPKCGEQLRKYQRHSKKCSAHNDKGMARGATGQPMK